ncbi:hypothetical protein LCGC14_3115780, partial [marine sediment metagenome]
MRPTIIDGRSVDQFIPSHLREMFYNNPIPQYKYATHDGYDPYGFSTDELVLYLPLWALKGSTFKSVDAYEHVNTVAGALWKPNGRDFDGSDDMVTIPNAVSTELGGASGATFLFWIKCGGTGTRDVLIDLS